MNPLTNIKKNKIQDNKIKYKKLQLEIKDDQRKNNHMIIKDIKEQKEQNRNASKKAKKNIKNDNNIKGNKITNFSKKTDINPKTNINKKISINNNNINKIENFLKSKAQQNDNLEGKKEKKNFLGSSINYVLIDEFKNDDFKPKTNIIKNPANKINIIKENKIKEEENDIPIPQFNLNNILIPMSNKTKENNCFLNVLIQTLFNLESFRENILKYFMDNSSSIQDEIVSEFYNLIKSYKLEQIKNEEILLSKEPKLSVNLLRNKLNLKYGNYFRGQCGDPMESLEHIFNSIHDEFTSNTLYKNKINKNFDCPIHQFFYLELIENLICRKCQKYNKRPYDKDCYMFQIFVSEICKRISKKNQNFENIHSKFFSQIKEQNENYDISNARLEGCKCAEINYKKRLNLFRVNNTYVVINLTWNDEFPDLKDILYIYTSLPLSDKNKNLFNVLDEKDQRTLYIKSIILYGIYHYICVIYLNKFKKWGIIDDKTIKYIDKYYDLVDYLLRNHLSPVGVIYSYDLCDKIDYNEIISNILTKDKYLQILKFCKGIDSSKNVKMSFINKSKESINSNNESYLDNNLFYKSFINGVIYSSSSSCNDEEKDKDENKLKKSSLKNKSSEEENEKNSINNEYHKVDMKLKAQGKNIKSSVIFFD